MSNNFLNIPDFASEINRSLGLNSAGMAMIKAQEEIKRKLQPFLGFQQQFNKSTHGISQLLRAGEIAAIQGVAKSIEWQSRFQLPSATVSALTVIQKQQEQFIGRWGNFTKLAQSGIVNAQMNSLQIALKGVSGTLARLAVTQQQWGLIYEFENINQVAIELTENSTPDVLLTPEESIAFSRLIERISAFVMQNKKFASYGLILINIIIAIAALHQYYDFLTKPESVTKADFAKFERKVTAEIHAKLIEQKEYRTVDRRCMVKLKPKSKSLTLVVLKKNIDVVVLQFKHEWVYISFIDDADNITESGWVLKKYLRKP
jgi:hypothetical protein